MIALVTDSNSQIPADLAARLGVVVVPILVSIDGVEYQEGIDIDADGFWDRFTGGAVPEVKTSQPSPGTVADVYRRCVAAGAREIVSVHVAESLSGTINSARLAAELVEVPVHVVDTGTASFGVTCCVWEAADVVADGGSAEVAATRAREVAPTVGTAFIVQALEFARSGGRFNFELKPGDEGVMVLAGKGTDVDLVATGRTLDELCDRMVEQLLAPDGDLRVGVCLADPTTVAFRDGIEERLLASGRALEVVRYRAGPSIAAHTGPGTAGGFSYPRRPPA